jgi:hypothetical protein
VKRIRSGIAARWLEKVLAWEPPPPLPWPRSRVPAALVAAALALVIGIGAVLAFLAGGGGGAAKLAAPPWYAGDVPCRSDPMAHVHDASRFILVARCSTVSGTVKSAHLDPADGTLKLQVYPDSPYRRYLTAANRGLLTAGIIPTDQPSLTAPAPGQHLTLYGAWVEERVINGVGRVRLHPTWGIQVSDPGQQLEATTASQARQQQPAGAAASTPHIDLSQSLSVKVTAPEEAGIGSPMAVSIAVDSLLEGQPKPAAGASIYCEVVGDGGRMAQWKAATVNGSGTARVDLLVSGPAGDYTLWVYAHKGVQGGIGRTRFTVTRG